MRKTFSTERMVPLCLGLCLLACRSGTETTAGDSSKTVDRPGPALPNVVILSIDTLRADHLGAYGYALDTSPAIDRFAQEAVVFSDAVSPAPSTAPAHMSLFTGMLPAVHRVANAKRTTLRKRDGIVRALDPSIKTYPEILRDRGYLTAGFHGGGNVHEDFGFGRGFDLYSDSLISYKWVDVYRSRSDLAAVRHWVQMGKQRSRPVFLFLHHYVCHAPYDAAPDTYRERFFQGKKVAGLPDGKPDRIRFGLSDELNARPFVEDRLRTIGAHVLRQGREVPGRFWEGIDMSKKGHRDHVVALYDAAVSFSDFLFDAIAKILKEEGVYDDTVFVLLSDHGEEFYEHGGVEHGRLFREHLHVPLIVRFPPNAKIGHRRIDTAVRSFDLFPTLFDFLGIDIDAPVQARSFLPLVKGEDEGAYAPPILSYTYDDFQAVRLERNGFVYVNENYPSGPEMLFDKKTDRGEKIDLSGARPEAVAKMRDLVQKTRAENEQFLQKLRRYRERQPSIDKKLYEKLVELGYFQKNDGP